MKKNYLSMLGAVCLATTAFAQPTTAPTAPTALAGNVISIFSDAYTPVSGVTIDPDWGPDSGAEVETHAGNAVVKLANLGYQGLDFGGARNVSSMENLHIDLWSSTATSMQLSLISQGPIEKAKVLTITMVSGWNSFDIPLSFYATAPAPLVQLSNVIQLKFDASTPAASTIYYDNIYFYQSASTPAITGFTIPDKIVTDADFTITDPTSNSPGAFTYTSSNTAVATITGNTIHIVGAGTSTITANQEAGGGFNAGSATTSFVVNYPPPTTAPTAPPVLEPTDVISIYSESYINITGVNYPYWGSGQRTQVSEQTYASNKVQRMTNFNYQGIGFDAQDISAMDMLHIDVWSPDCTSLDTYLIKPGDPENYKRSTLVLGTWNSLDIPLSDFTSQGVNLNGISLFKFQPNPFPGADASLDKTIFFDNIYFYKASALPVSLSNFDAKLNANEVSLTWITASESNNKGFAIERSQNGTDWQQLGFVNGQDNSSKVNKYSFADKNPLQGVNYYRLLQEDNNGKTTPSEVKSVNFNVSALEKLTLYPNPVSDKLFVQIGVINNNNANISLVDLKGNIVKSIAVNSSNSNSTIDITLQGVQGGIYFLMLKDGRDTSSSKIIVK